MSPPSSSFDTGSQHHCSLPKSKQFVARPSPSSPPNTQQAQSAAPSPRSVSSSAPPTARPTPAFKSPAPLKKDPMACLFVPKHRAYSQRPVS
jgi:elongin-A